MPEYWIGLDTGYDSTSFCVTDEDGVIVTEGSCASEVDAVLEVISGYDLANLRQISIEAGVGTHIVRRLRALDYPVCVHETRRSGKFLAINRSKTDQNDAIGLAHFGRLAREVDAGVFVKSLECQNLRTRLTARHKLIELRMAIEGLVQSIVRLHGGKLKLSRRIGGLTEDIEVQLAALSADGLDVESDVRPLVTIAEAIRSLLADLDRRLKDMVKSHPVCSLLLTVPGVGPITAASYYSAVGSPDRFKNNRDVGSYFGLAPILRQSGRYSRQGGISKMGSKLTRIHLVTAATVLLSKSHSDCALRQWGIDLAKRTSRKKAQIALARKLAVVMLAMWKSGEKFDQHRGSQQNEASLGKMAGPDHALGTGHPSPQEVVRTGLPA